MSVSGGVCGCVHVCMGSLRAQFCRPTINAREPLGMSSSPPTQPSALTRTQVLDINILMILAVIGAIAIGDYTEAGAVVVLFALALFLENRCSQQAKRAIQQVIAMQPVHATLADSGARACVHAS